MDQPVQKICCICGMDVSRVRRTKDPRGNYYCKPCYTARLAEYRRRLAEAEAQQREAAAAAEGSEDSGAIHVPAGRSGNPSVTPSHTHFQTSTETAEHAGSARGWAGIMTWLAGAEPGSADALAERRTAVEVRQFTAVAAAPEPERVEVRRKVPRRRRGEIRLSDLVSAEAQAEVAAAATGGNQGWFSREPEIPASPDVNPPVSAIIADYSRALLT